MTRKSSLRGSVLLTVIFVALLFLEESVKSNFCGSRDLSCWRNYNLILTILLLSPTLLISSLASLKASDEAFSKWKSMTLYFIPAYLLIVILTPWDMGNAMAGPSLSKGMVALALCVIYLVFSVFYLLTKSSRKIS